MVAQKKHEEKSKEQSKQKPAQNAVNAKEKIGSLDVATETVESVRVVEAVLTSQAPSTDPLKDFKEKMEEELSMPDSSQKNYMWPILSIFIIAVVLLVGVFAYKQGMFKREEVNVVSLTPTPTIAPSPVKTLDLTQYEIEILNGSEVDGEASRQKGDLEGEGFTVSSIGNADNSDYTDTIIEAKKEVDPDFIVKLKDVLSETFTIGETQSLPESSSVPVVIILGTKK